MRDKILHFDPHINIIFNNFNYNNFVFNLPARLSNSSKL